MACTPDLLAVMIIYTSRGKWNNQGTLPLPACTQSRDGSFGCLVEFIFSVVCGPWGNRPLSLEGLSLAVNFEVNFPQDQARSRGFALMLSHTPDNRFTCFGSQSDKRVEQQR